MIKQIKKGFTLVELVIVIAVIAILASILIPTFTNLINEANEASDTVLVKNMNTILATEYDESPERYEDALYILQQNGYLIEKMNPTAKGNRFLWDEESNSLVYIDSDCLVIYSNVFSEGEDVSSNTKLWLTIDSTDDVVEDESFSYLLTTNLTIKDTLEIRGSFNTATYQVNSGDIKFVGSEAVFYGKLDNLEIDSSTAHVSNYSSANEITITNLSSNSYYEYGYVKNLVIGANITTQTVEVTSQAMINTLTIETSSTNANLDLSSAYIEEIAGTGSTTVSYDIPTDYTLNINSYIDLINFRDKVNGGATYYGLNVSLNLDIDLTNKAWYPIGISQRDDVADDAVNDYANVYYFAGTFDGNNHTISGLSNNGYNPAETRYDTQTGEFEFLFGLFGVVVDAEIKNLTMSNVDISRNYISSVGELDSAGAIVAFAADGVTLTNCHANGTIYGFSGLGGLVGRIYAYEAKEIEISFENCSNSVNVTCANKHAAGFVGYIAAIKFNESYSEINLTFKGCSNHGNIHSEDTEQMALYAILGTGYYTITFEECTNSGTHDENNGITNYWLYLNTSMSITINKTTLTTKGGCYAGGSIS